MKTMKRIIKKAFTSYCEKAYKAHKRCIDAGLNPWM